MKKLKTYRYEDQLLNSPGRQRGDGHNEDHGETHTHCGLGVFRNPDERTQPQELGEYEVFDKDKCNDDTDVAHTAASLLFLASVQLKNAFK